MIKVPYLFIYEPAESLLIHSVRVTFCNPHHSSSVSDMASPEFRSEGSSSKLTLRLKEVAVRLTRLNEHQLSSWGAKNVDTVREEAKARVQYTSARDKEPSEVVARAASWTPDVGQDVEDVDTTIEEFRSEGSSSKLTLRLKEVAVRLTRLNEHQLSSWGAKNVDTVREEAKARVQYTSARDKEPSEVVARAASWTPAVGQDVEDVDTTIEEVIERVLQGAPKEGPTRVTLCRRHSASRKDLVVLKEPQGSESGRPGDPCQWCHQARHVSTGHALYKDVFFCSVMRGQSVDQWLRKQRGGQAEDTIPRTTEWNLVQRLKREEAQEERDGDDEEAPRRKKSKPYKLRICQQCGQPKQKDYGHCQYGGQHYCALYGCKTARLWLAEKRQRKAP
ncbi:uncharacterized protein LOC128765389 isoform X3 [Synchiropus splendidus]|uniref:uncharacterized protein LOC128765389 isoform X3 n=1 Tax=Synchiropus splendidus TaxID=270530 RepID=UPI00237ED3B3|nr:uncharacterized protein LOC128765389 isoform X3 [Synchiropus splendidus]